MSFLKEIVREKKFILKEKKSRAPFSELKKREWIDKLDFFNRFKERNTKETKIISEVKKASPSKGILRENFKHIDIAKIYEENGAYAISVITEEKFFQGSLHFLSDIKKAVKLPVLRKDFLIDEYEIFESKSYSADCILLISEILERSQIKDFLDITKEIDLDVLLEIHSLKAYEKVSDLSGFLLGINNRDLETLKIDVNNAFEIIKSIPPNLPIIVESGIDDRKTIERYLDVGVSGFLIGTSLIKSSDIGKKLRELIGIL